MKKLILIVLFLSAVAWAQVFIINTVHINRFFVQPPPSNPPALSAYEYYGTDNTLHCINPDGSGCLPGSGSSAIAGINTQTASYQAMLSDANSYVRMNSASANNFTVPADGTTNFPLKTVITVRQVGAGVTTIVAAGGVTITSPSTLVLRAQYSTIQLIKVAANTWDLAGDVQ